MRSNKAPQWSGPESEGEDKSKSRKVVSVKWTYIKPTCHMYLHRRTIHGYESENVSLTGKTHTGKALEKKHRSLSNGHEIVGKAFKELV
jgi:hypothetical protein